MHAMEKDSIEYSGDVKLSIKELDLHDKQLMTFSAFIQNKLSRIDVTTVHSLNVSYNQLCTDEVNSLLSHLVNLESLNASHNNLTAVPNIPRFLKKLYLNHNQITTWNCDTCLPSEEIDLSDNPLAEVIWNHSQGGFRPIMRLCNTDLPKESIDMLHNVYFNTYYKGEAENGVTNAVLCLSPYITVLSLGAFIVPSIFLLERQKHANSINNQTVNRTYTDADRDIEMLSSFGVVCACFTGACVVGGISYKLLSFMCKKYCHKQAIEQEKKKAWQKVLERIVTGDIQDELTVVDLSE